MTPEYKGSKSFKVKVFSPLLLSFIQEQEENSSYYHFFYSALCNPLLLMRHFQKSELMDSFQFL